jgi:hypothetical protein
MGRSHAPRDIVQRIIDVERVVDQLKQRARHHTETKTFIVGGEVTSSITVPPAVVNVNPDGQSAETKRLISFHGIATTGSLDVYWKLNGTTILTGHTIDTTGSTGGTRADLLTGHGSLPLLTGENWITLVINTGTATDISAGFTVVTDR